MIEALFLWIILNNQLRFCLLSDSNSVPKLITLTSDFQWKHLCQFSPKLSPVMQLQSKRTLTKNGEFSYPKRQRQIRQHFRSGLTSKSHQEPRLSSVIYWLEPGKGFLQKFHARFDNWELPRGRPDTDRSEFSALHEPRLDSHKPTGQSCPSSPDLGRSSYRKFQRIKEALGQECEAWGWQGPIMNYAFSKVSRNIQPYYVFKGEKKDGFSWFYF